MRNRRNFVFGCLLMGLGFFLLAAPRPADAFLAPYYAYGEVYTTSAVWFPSTLTPEYHQENDQYGAPGSVSVGDGHGSSDIAGYYGEAELTPVFYSPASSGAVTANPGTGTIQAISRTSHRDNNGVPVSYEVQLPGTNPFEYQPFNWGDASSFGYVRSVWEITASDESLEIGDPVSIQANLNVEGVLSGDTSTLRAMVFLNTMDDVSWLDSQEYLHISVVDDFGLTPVLSFADESEESGSHTVSYIDAVQKDFQVGDIIVLEALMATTSSLTNDGIERSTSADFANTLESVLTVQTPGVSLVPYDATVPIPAAAWLFGSGLLSLLFIRRKNGR